MNNKCSLCEKKQISRGFCSKHYNEYRNSTEYTPSTPKTISWIKSIIDTDLNECIIWPFARNKAGYGNIYYNGKHTVASRVVCEFRHGKADHGMDAAHSCGNGHKGCVNPNHLSWKSKEENEADKLLHGTRFRGADCSFSKYSWELVDNIKNDLGLMRGSEVAEKYGVSRQFVSKIKLSRSWNEIGYDRVSANG